jgi:hypothetical protein
MRRKRKREPQPVQVDDVAEEIVARGRRLALRRGVMPGALVTIGGFSEPMFVEHVDFRLAGLGRPCVVVHPPGDWRRDAVVRLRDVGGPPFERRERLTMCYLQKPVESVALAASDP